jgi:hypothetical protein
MYGDKPCYFIGILALPRGALKQNIMYLLQWGFSHMLILHLSPGRAINSRQPEQLTTYFRHKWGHMAQKPYSNSYHRWRKAPAIFCIQRLTSPEVKRELPTGKHQTS